MGRHCPAALKTHGSHGLQSIGLAIGGAELATGETPLEHEAAVEAITRSQGHGQSGMAAVRGAIRRHIPPLVAEATRQIGPSGLHGRVVDIVATKAPGIDAVLVKGTSGWEVTALIVRQVETRPQLMAIPAVDAEMPADRNAGAVIKGSAQVSEGEVDTSMNTRLEVLSEGCHSEAKRGGEQSDLDSGH